METIYTGTPFERSPDLAFGTEWLGPEQAPMLAYVKQFGGNALAFTYWNGRTRSFVVCKTRRAKEQWLKDNDLVDHNRDAFRKYCNPVTYKFFGGEEAYYNPAHYPEDLDQYLEDRKAFDEMVNKALE